MNKFLFVLLMFSLFGVFSIKYIWGHISEKWDYGEETGDVLFNLSVGFISAYIFYILDIFIPEIKKNKQINTKLEQPLNRILKNMLFSISCVSELTNLNYKDLTTQNIDSNLKKDWSFNLAEAPMVKYDLSKLTYYQFFYHNKLEIEDYVKRINQLPHLNFNLKLLIDEITYSEFHDNLEYMKNLRIATNTDLNFSRSFLVNTFEEYTNVMYKLVEYMKVNKIKINNEIEDLI